MSWNRSRHGPRAVEVPIAEFFDLSPLPSQQLLSTATWLRHGDRAYYDYLVYAAPAAIARTVCEPRDPAFLDSARWTRMSNAGRMLSNRGSRGRQLTMNGLLRQIRGPARWLLLMLAMVAWAGCSPGEPPHPAATTNSSNSSAARSEPDHLHPPKGSKEKWFAWFVEGAKAGHIHSAISRSVEHDQPIVRIDEEAFNSLSRNGQPSETRITSSSVETPEGRLLRFKTEIHFGADANAIVTSGELQGAEMQLKTTAPPARPLRPPFPGPMESAASMPILSRSKNSRCSRAKPAS